MSKIVFAINISADGYCGHEAIVPDDELLWYFTGTVRNAGTLLFGRITYELMVPYWPDIAKNPSESEADRAYALAFEAVDKVVFSTTLKTINGNKTRIVRANMEEEVLSLKQSSGKDIYVSGLSIASQLSQRGLIDEYIFAVSPVVAGNGPRLFESVKLQERLPLELIDSKIFQSGVVALRYRKHS
jgi:dihydrofolate reductase